MEKIEREIKDIEELIKLITDIPEGTIVEVNLGEEEDDG
jgi:hypothetical protein